MFTRSRKRLNIISTLLAFYPFFILILFAIFFSNYINLGLTLLVVGEVLLIIAFAEAKRVHKKLINLAKTYQQGLNEYVSDQMKKEKDKRRNEFLKDTNKHNMLDDIYFGKDENRENDYMKKGKSNFEIFGEYVANMHNNAFLEKARFICTKKNLKIEEVFNKVKIDFNYLEALTNPEYRLPRPYAIRVCFGLELSLEEANNLLASSQYHLDKLREYDCAICYFFDNKLYDIDFINLALLSEKYEEI